MKEALEVIALANLALLAAFVVAWLIEAALKRTRYRTAYPLRLNLAIAAITATSLPFILHPVKNALNAALNINVTDIVVAQYLKGNLNISATHLTDVIDAKNSFLQDITGASTTLSLFLFGAFLIAALLRASYIALNWIRVRRVVASSTLIRQTHRVDVLVSDRIRIPFSTRGVFRYCIVVPSEIAKDKRSAAIVLSHEAQHIRQHDVDWELFLSLISPLFIMNPAFYFLSARIRRFREYSCDSELLARGRVNAKAYCMLLLEVAAKASRVRRGDAPGALSASVPFIGRELFWHRSSHSALRQRVLAISAISQSTLYKPSRLTSIVPAAALATLMALAVIVLAKPADWSHDRIMLSTVVNLERLDRINAFGVEPLR